jgi:large subunit ribosomal protein L18
MKDKKIRFEFRRKRVSRKLAANTERPRLSVHRSARHLYAQVVDDNAGRTLAFASSLSKEVRGGLKSGKNLSAAKVVGELIAKRALSAGVKQVRFDRRGHRYHGRIQALADAARQAGLEF